MDFNHFNYLFLDNLYSNETDKLSPFQWYIGIAEPTDRKKMSKIAMKMAGTTISSITLSGGSDKLQKIKFRSDKLSKIPFWDKV